MQTIFAAPMRQNNNTTLDSGLQRLSDWVADVSAVGGIHLRIDCSSIDAGDQLIVHYAMFNGGVEVGSSQRVISAPGKYEIGFSRGDFDNTSDIQGTVQVVGRSRFSLEVLTSAKGEDIPDEGWYQGQM